MEEARGYGIAVAGGIDQTHPLGLGALKLAEGAVDIEMESRAAAADAVGGTAITFIGAADALVLAKKEDEGAIG